MSHLIKDVTFFSGNMFYFDPKTKIPKPKWGVMLLAQRLENVAFDILKKENAKWSSYNWYNYRDKGKQWNYLLQCDNNVTKSITVIQQVVYQIK